MRTAPRTRSRRASSAPPARALAPLFEMDPKVKQSKRADGFYGWIAYVGRSRTSTSRRPSTDYSTFFERDLGSCGELLPRARRPCSKMPSIAAGSRPLRSRTESLEKRRPVGGGAIMVRCGGRRRGRSWGARRACSRRRRRRRRAAQGGRRPGSRLGRRGRPERRTPLFPKCGSLVDERFRAHVEPSETHSQAAGTRLSACPVADDAPLAAYQDLPRRQGELESKNHALRPGLSPDQRHPRPRQGFELALEKLFFSGVGSGNADGWRRSRIGSHATEDTRPRQLLASPRCSGAASFGVLARGLRHERRGERRRGRELERASTRSRRPSSAAGHEVVCAPGNAGTATVGRNVPVAANDVPRLGRPRRHRAGEPCRRRPGAAAPARAGGRPRGPRRARIRSFAKSGSARKGRRSS